MSFLTNLIRRITCRHKVVLQSNVYNTLIPQREDLEERNVEYRLSQSYNDYDVAEPWRSVVDTTFYFRKVEDAVHFKLKWG